MGAASPARWQLMQRWFRIGATSFEKVGTALSAANPPVAKARVRRTNLIFST
jgi:hypothetical protein